MKFYFASKYSSTRFGIRTTECWYNCGWYACTLRKIFPLALYWILQVSHGGKSQFSPKKNLQKFRKKFVKSHDRRMCMRSSSSASKRIFKKVGDISWRFFLKLKKKEKSENLEISTFYDFLRKPIAELLPKSFSVILIESYCSSS